MDQGKKYLSSKERLKKIQTHSKYFSYLKYTLLCLFLLGFLFFLYFIWLKDVFIKKETNDSFISIPTKREVLEKRIINPEYFSYDKDKKPFIIQAATSYKLDSDHFFLKKPHCKSFKDATSPVIIDSQEGKLQDSTKELYLQGDVTLKKEDLTFITNSLHFDTKIKEGYGKEPIIGISPDKQITAGEFQINDEGNIFCFQQGEQIDRPTLILYEKEAHNDR